MVHLMMRIPFTAQVPRTTGRRHRTGRRVVTAEIGLDRMFLLQPESSRYSANCFDDWSAYITNYYGDSRNAAQRSAKGSLFRVFSPDNLHGFIDYSTVIRRYVIVQECNQADHFSKRIRGTLVLDGANVVVPDLDKVVTEVVISAHWTTLPTI